MPSTGRCKQQGDFKSMFDKLPDTLYHYTSQIGFSGIIKEKKMRATAIRYLNDAKEFQYAIGLIIKAMRVLRSEFTSDDEPFLLELEKTMNRVMEHLETDRTEIFVCSFSGLEDKLSQWRGYCNNGNGYCICFDAQKLKSLAAGYKARFAPSIYRENEQLQKIRETLEEGLDGYFYPELKVASSKHLDIHNSAQIAAQAFAVIFMTQTAPFLKDPSWEEEHEWRLSLCPEIYGPDLFPQHLKHRMGESKTMIPYIEISLIGHWGHYGHLPFKKIYVSPTADKNAKKFAEEFLQTHGIDNCEVENSKIPYRLL